MEPVPLSRNTGLLRTIRVVDKKTNRGLTSEVFVLFLRLEIIRVVRRSTKETMGTTNQTPITIDPPQPPGAGEYPISALIPSFIKEFTNRTDYAMKTGKPAPEWNPALPKKGWIDSSAPTGTFVMLTYNTAHLDASFQHPVVTQITVPNYLAGTINLPPDSGPFSPSSGGEYLTPIRALLPNEKLVPRQMGLFDVVNTDIYDPNPPVVVGAGTGAGSFTEADRAALAATQAAVAKIASAMGL